MECAVSLRRAIGADAAALTLLAVASKAAWGYDSAFMHRAGPALRVTAQYVENNPVYVLEQAGATVGFFGFIASEGTAELNDFWIDPPFIGRGMGRRLWAHAVAVARDLRYTAFTIHSDPNAEKFYLHMGAIRTGTRIAPETGRALPLLYYRVPDS